VGVSLIDAPDLKTMMAGLSQNVETAAGTTDRGA